ncbi:hypothetical protein [Nostoc sp. PCC 9305]|uniref:hypothetical protein n=1 Tax=Nostoc sp. PCC 9305 TaxID=296636 RepID=UPI0039C66047
MISRHWCIRLNPYTLRNLTPVNLTGAFHQPLLQAVKTSGCEAKHYKFLPRLVSWTHIITLG